MRLKELMGSLLTFEIELNEESKERKKRLGLRIKYELPVKGMNLQNLWPFYQRILKKGYKKG